MSRRLSALCFLLALSSPAWAGKPASGLAPGQDVVPWNPIHVAGPDQGTNACPVCTYLERPAVLIFTRDGKNAAALAARVEALVVANRDRELKGFVAVLDSTPKRLAEMAKQLHITHSAVCYPNAEERDKDLKAYKIHPAAANTVMVYQKYKVVATFVDLDAADFARMEAVVKALPR